MRKIFVRILSFGCGFVGLITIQAQSKYEPYSFTTLAGVPPGNADGQGTTARFQYPGNMVVDAAGNLYVTDTNSHTIRKVTADGTVTTFAGSPGVQGYVDGPRTAARFSYPVGIAWDNAGNLLVADSSNGAIRKITPDGMVSTFAGGTVGTGSDPALTSAAGITVDNSGNVYVADNLGETIRKITASGVVTTLAGQSGFSGDHDDQGDRALFDGPQGVAADNAGNVYVADSNNDQIRIITPDGSVRFYSYLPLSGNTEDTAGYYLPQGVAVDSAQNVYVANSGGNTIRRIDPSSRDVTTIAGSTFDYAGSTDGVGTAARFDNPTGLAFDASGNIYVADASNATIRKIDPALNVTTIAGLASPGYADGPSSTAHFANPAGVAIDGAGNVFVADTSNNTIRKITTAGVVTTLAGSPHTYGNTDGNGSDARFSHVEAVAVDGAGNIYAADNYNKSIRKITPAGEVSTFATFAYHSSNFPFGDDAEFGLPGGVAVDSSGNVYAALTDGDIVVKITSTGQQSILAGNPGVSGHIDGTGSAARFRSPTAVALDTTGNLYVADTLNDSIRKVTQDGVVTTLPGGPFYRSHGVTVDTDGNVYLTVTFEGTIQKITSSGEVSILGGIPNNRENADGTGIAARFWSPAGIAVDSSGTLFIADSKTNTIRMGVPSTLPISSPANISTRIAIGTDDNVLIGGFIITGSAAKKVIIRAIGPSLPITGALSDPTLELHNPGGTIVTNDNWKVADATGQSQEAEINATTIPPSNDLESAIVQTLVPGAYTAIVRGKNDGIGIGLVEAYDLDQTAPAKLANISTRGSVGTGNNVLIGGFILTPESSAGGTVLIRAIGPSLPVNGALSDPNLELHDGNGSKIASNDNWKIADSNGASQETDIRATTIPPSNDLESAILTTLLPGNYTAIVSGKDSTTGVGLVEVYGLE